MPFSPWTTPESKLVVKTTHLLIPIVSLQVTVKIWGHVIKPWLNHLDLRGFSVTSEKRPMGNWPLWINNTKPIPSVNARPSPEFLKTDIGEFFKTPHLISVHCQYLANLSSKSVYGVAKGYKGPIVSGPCTIHHCDHNISLNWSWIEQYQITPAAARLLTTEHKSFMHVYTSFCHLSWSNKLVHKQPLPTKTQQ